MYGFVCRYRISFDIFNNHIQVCCLVLTIKKIKKGENHVGKSGQVQLRSYTERTE